MELKERKCNLFWVGQFRGISGFAQSTRNYVSSILPYYPSMTIGSISALDDDDPFKKYCKDPKDPFFEICNHLPVTNPWADGFFSVCEYDGLPNEFYEGLQDAKLVMTQSEFCKGVFSKYVSTSTPIHVIPHILTENFRSVGASKRYFSKDYFIFGSVFEWVPRKMPYHLIQAFIEEFERNEDVVLVIKTFNHGFDSLSNHLKEKGFNYTEKQLKKIVIINDVFPDLSVFYRGLDAYISCTAGEGYGQTLCEAMACGIPTIASNHSGNLDFMNDQNSFLVDVEGWTPTEEFPTVNWRKPKIESMKSKMRTVYDNRNSDYMKKITNSAQKLSGALTMEKIGKKIVEALNQFC